MPQWTVIVKHTTSGSWPSPEGEDVVTTATEERWTLGAPSEEDARLRVKVRWPHAEIVRIGPPDQVPPGPHARTVAA